MRRLLNAAAGLLVATFAGCGTGAQIGGPPAGSSGWMAREAASHDLLYVTDVGANEVFVYTYPQGSLVGTLTGFNSPIRACSDGSGNVFITNSNSQQILKYAHGGTKSIGTYRDSGFLPVDCSVDPTSGTLAATNYSTTGSNTGSVAIYAGGKGRPAIYHAANVQAYLFCTYDGAGNLFVDGLNDNYDFVLIELPKGAKKFEQITVKQTLRSWGGIQWDGTYLAVGDGVSTIYDFAVKGTSAKKVRLVQLRRAVNVVQFWLDGSTLIGPDGPNGARRDAGLWNYPGGGAPTKTVGSGVFENPSGATVSVAPKR
jgi:hypothetical protein